MNDDGDSNNKLIKIDAKLDTYKGNVVINLLEILGQLDDEQKQELMSDGGWWNLISKEMAEKIVKEFSRENYNEEYTKLRGLIINSESMPSVIRQWAISIFESMENAREAEKYWNQAYWELYHQFIKYIDENGDRRISKSNLIPDLPRHYYGKEYSKELMKDVENKVQEWKLLFPDKEDDEENKE
jgi:hypothetical protein